MHSWVLRKESSTNRQLLVHNRSIDAFGCLMVAFGALRRAFPSKRPIVVQWSPTPAEASAVDVELLPLIRIESGYWQVTIKRTDVA